MERNTMTKEQERTQLIECIKKALELNISNCHFMKNVYRGNKNIISTLNKSIKQSEKALNDISFIKHIEVLRALYGDIVGKISNSLMLGGTLIVAKKTNYFDKNEKGFKEFCEIQEENKKIYAQKIKEQQESREAIEKAKQEGKKVEYMVDPITKKLKPIIVEENNNA